MGRNLEEREALNEGIDEVIEDITEARDAHIADLVCGSKPAEQIHIEGIIEYVRQHRQGDLSGFRRVRTFESLLSDTTL